MQLLLVISASAAASVSEHHPFREMGLAAGSKGTTAITGILQGKSPSKDKSCKWRYQLSAAPLSPRVDDINPVLPIIRNVP